MCHPWQRSQLTRPSEEDEEHKQVPGGLRTGREGAAWACSHVAEGPFDQKCKDYEAA